MLFGLPAEVLKQQQLRWLEEQRGPPVPTESGPAHRADQRKSGCGRNHNGGVTTDCCDCSCEAPCPGQVSDSQVPKQQQGGLSRSTDTIPPTNVHYHCHHQAIAGAGDSRRRLHRSWNGWNPPPRQCDVWITTRSGRLPHKHVGPLVFTGPLEGCSDGTATTYSSNPNTNTCHRHHVLSIPLLQPAALPHSTVGGESLSGVSLVPENASARRYVGSFKFKGSNGKPVGELKVQLSFVPPEDLVENGSSAAALESCSLPQLTCSRSKRACPRHAKRHRPVVERRRHGYHRCGHSEREAARAAKQLNNGRPYVADKHHHHRGRHSRPASQKEATGRPDLRCSTSAGHTADTYHCRVCAGRLPGTATALPRPATLAADSSRLCCCISGDASLSLDQKGNSAGKPFGVGSGQAVVQPHRLDEPPYGEQHRETNGSSYKTGDVAVPRLKPLIPTVLLPLKGSNSKENLYNGRVERQLVNRNTNVPGAHVPTASTSGTQSRYTSTYSGRPADQVPDDNSKWNFAEGSSVRCEDWFLAPPPASNGCPVGAEARKKASNQAKTDRVPTQTGKPVSSYEDFHFNHSSPMPPAHHNQRWHGAPPSAPMRGTPQAVDAVSQLPPTPPQQLTSHSPNTPRSSATVAVSPTTAALLALSSASDDSDYYCCRSESDSSSPSSASSYYSAALPTRSGTDNRFPVRPFPADGNASTVSSYLGSFQSCGSIIESHTFSPRLRLRQIRCLALTVHYLAALPLGNRQHAGSPAPGTSLVHCIARMGGVELESDPVEPDPLSSPADGTRRHQTVTSPSSEAQSAGRVVVLESTFIFPYKAARHLRLVVAATPRAHEGLRSPGTSNNSSGTVAVALAKIELASVLRRIQANKALESSTRRGGGGTDRNDSSGRRSGSPHSGSHQAVRLDEDSDSGSLCFVEIPLEAPTSGVHGAGPQTSAVAVVSFQFLPEVVAPNPVVLTSLELLRR